MYVNPFVFGFGLGILVGVVGVLIFAYYMGRRK